MRKMYILVFTLISLLVSTTLLAQQKITGKIVGQNNDPLAGATIALDNSKKATVSNTDGLFEIIADNADQSIAISNVGYTAQSIAIKGNTYLLVKLVANSTLLDDFVVVGSRKAQRTKLNSIAPVDVIRLSDVQLQMPQIGINELLNQLVPSFNSNRQSASDGTEHIDPASLRGLGPDQVLVLVNGKRRHTTSLINYQNTVGNGAVGTDLNAIPTSAIDRIEVLRDGAAAQYGSDAIAGVINIILKKNTGLTASVTGGGASRGDGELFNVNANYGAGLSKDKGFINLTIEANNRNSTNRSQNHDLVIFDQSSIGNFFAYPFTNNANISRAFDDSVIGARGLNRNDFNFNVGDAKSTNYQGLINFGYKLKPGTEIYATTGLSVRNGRGFGFRRLPGENSNVVASIYRNGFQPTLNSSISDYSLITGLKQQLGNWQLDFSNTYGRNSFEYNVKNSNNSSLGSKSPTSFNAGSHAFVQNTINADISRAITKGNNVIGLAFGAEYRYEKFSITKGQEESWKLYTDNPAGIAGAQSFPGFSPANEVNAGRNSFSAYADADFSFNKKFVMATALRFENYSDFGSTLNGKLGLRYNISDAFAVRGTISTGFRAPSLHQQNFSNFYSDIAQNGSGIINKGIFPINSPVAKAIGMPALKQETSINYSAGFTAKPAKNLAITVDGYIIDINNRIVITSSITDPRIAALGVESGRFFTNAINTSTKGLDIVATYTVPFKGINKLDFSLASNFNETKITKYSFPSSLIGIDLNNYFGPDQQSLIETNNPASRHTFTTNLALNKFNFMVRNVYWGSVTRNGFPFGVVQKHKGKITTDLAIAYKINSSISFTLGANNLLDIFPDKQARENSYFGVFKYAPVQMGMLGAFYYARLNVAIK